MSSRILEFERDLGRVEDSSRKVFIIINYDV